MKLLLLHGRKTPDEELNDWGFNGPDIEGIAWAHTTYSAHVMMGFFTEEAMKAAQEATGWEVLDDQAFVLEATICNGDLLETKDGYFGDWEFQEDYEAHKVLRDMVMALANNKGNEFGKDHAEKLMALIQRIET